MKFLLLVLLVGCGPASTKYTSDDTTANTIAAKNEAATYEECSNPDAGACVPGVVRLRASIAFCANQRELTVHSAAFDGGIQCPSQ